MLCSCLIGTGLVIKPLVVEANNATKIDTIVDIGKELEKRNQKLPSYGGSGAHADASSEPGVSNITSALYWIVEFMKYILGSIAVLLIIVSGIRLVTASDKVDETATKEKLHLTYSAVAFVLIIIADQAVKNVFFGESGEILSSSENAIKFARQGGELFKNIYRVLQYVIGTIAVMMFVISGIQYALSGGNDDNINKSKKRIQWGVVGLMVVGVSELVVFDIVFPDQGRELPRVQRAVELIVTITNFASAFIATLAILGFAYAGYLYVSGGVKEDNVEKGKKALIAAIIGIIFAAAAFAIANTLLAGLVDNPG